MNQNDIILADDVNTSLNNLQTQIQGLKLKKVWETPYPPQAGEFPSQTITINEVVSEFIIYYQNKGNGTGTGFCHGRVRFDAITNWGNNISITWTEVNDSTSQLKLYVATRPYGIDVSSGTSTTFQFSNCSYSYVVATAGATSANFNGVTDNHYILPLAIYKVEDIYNS